MAGILTEKAIQGFKLKEGEARHDWPDGGQHDEGVHQLAFRLTRSGSRSWSLRYWHKGKVDRITIGPYRPPDTKRDGYSLAEARTRARLILKAIREGADPNTFKASARTERLVARAEGDGRPEGPTLEHVVGLWFASDKAKAWRPGTRREFERLMRKEVLSVWGQRPPAEVSKADIRERFDSIAKERPSIAKHFLATLRLFYRWASEEDHVERAPDFPERNTQSNKRTRVLNDGELRAVWAALDEGITEAETGLANRDVDAMAEAFRLMLLTGQRRGEVLSMAWADLDGSSWTIPALRFKGGKREQHVPLSKPAVASLERVHTLTGSGEFVFPAPHANTKEPFVTNPQFAAKRLWKQSKVKGATLHDLRRTVATNLARLGFEEHLIGHVLGHAARTVTGQRYNKHAYENEKREALDAWAADLARILKAKEEGKGKAKVKGKVLPWARGA